MNRSTTRAKPVLDAARLLSHCAVNGVMEAEVASEKEALLKKKEFALVIENSLEDRVQRLRQIMEYKEAKRSGRNVRLVEKSSTDA